MTTASLSRHKKICRSAPTKLVNPDSVNGNNSNVISSVSHRIETFVRVDTYSDGRTIIVSDEIKLNNVSLVLVPKPFDNSDGKYSKIH